MKATVFSSLIIIAAVILTGCIGTTTTKSYQAPMVTETPVDTSYEIKNESQPLVKVEVVRQVTESTSDWMFRTSGFYLGQGYLINRGNVSGFKDLRVNITVYGYKFLSNFYESSADRWGTNSWWPHVPDTGNKFVFVFVRSEMEGNSVNNDPRMWGFDSSHFSLQYKDHLVSEFADHSKCVAIREMENVFTFNDDSRISDYGMLRIENLQHPVNGISCEALGFLRMGKSNAWDGYLIYQVPKDATDRDMKMLGAFNGFGDAWWYLYRKPV
jgi:hypothetical protein